MCVLQRRGPAPEYIGDLFECSAADLLSASHARPGQAIPLRIQGSGARIFGLLRAPDARPRSAPAHPVASGGEAVSVAEAFHQTLAIDGVILTKLDGDARGGAALSVKEVIGRPIAFASTGEKLSEFEQFHPDRMAGRILGMGDMLTLIEQAEQAFEKDQAEAAATKLMEGEFTLDDFLEQMQALKKMGPLGNLMGMMPGMPKELKGAQIGDDQLKPIEAIIHSMTPLERRKPEIINGSRRNRIALGSGTSVGDVNRLVKQFGEMQKMMKKMGAMSGFGRPGKKGKKGKPARGFPGMPPGLGGGGFPGMPGAPDGGFPGLPGMGGGSGGFPKFN